MIYWCSYITAITMVCIGVFTHVYSHVSTLQHVKLIKPFIIFINIYVNNTTCANFKFILIEGKFQDDHFLT